MQTLQNLPDLGNTIPGTDDDSNLVNQQFLGGLRWFESLNSERERRYPQGFAREGAWICGVLLRNVSGGALLGGNLARLNTSGTADEAAYTEVVGYANAVWQRNVVLIDPWLPAAGVPDDACFWGIVKGPAPGRTPQDTANILATITAGASVHAAADALGRITAPKATPASDTEAYAQAISALGIFAETQTAGSGLVLVYWNNPVFG